MRLWQRCLNRWERGRWVLAAMAGGALALGLAFVKPSEGWDWPSLWLLVRDVGLIALVSAAAWGIGSSMAHWWRGYLNAAEDHLARLAVGLGGLGAVVFALGLLGWLRRPVLAGLLGVGGGLAFGFRAQGGTAVRASSSVGGRWATTVAWSIAGVALAVAFVGALVPETFYDALYYHAAFPAQILRLGRLELFPHAVHSAMPAHLHMCYLLVLAWGGASSVKLAHFALYFGTVWGVAVLARRLWGEAAAPWAALVMASLPGMGAMAGLGAVDCGVTFFTTVCVVLTLAGLDKTTKGGVLCAAAFTAGVAAGCKYSALLFVVVWGLAVLLALLVRRACPGSLLLRLVVLVLLGGGSWYLRNLLMLGTPFYPALAPPDSEAARVAENLRADSAPPGSWLQTPQMLMEVLGEQKEAGAGAEIWPGALWLLTGIVWALGRPGPPRWLAGAVVIALLMWSHSILIVRYAYPYLAVGAALAAGFLGAGFLWPRWQRAVQTLAVAVAALAVVRLVLVLDVVHQQPWAYLRGEEEVTTFLRQRVRGFAAARCVAAHTAEEGTRLLLLGETKGYYFFRNYEPVSGYDRHPLLAWAEAAADAHTLAGHLRNCGFTHLVWDAEELERLHRRYGHAAASPRAKRVLGELLARCPPLCVQDGVKVYRLGR